MRASPPHIPSAAARFLPGWLPLAYAFTLFLSLLLSPSASAQMKEPRILQEDRTKAFQPDRAGKTTGIKTFDSGGPARTKGFSFRNIFKSKDYRTSSFRSNAWSGQTAYKTDNAKLQGKSSHDRLATGYKTEDHRIKTTRFVENAREKDAARKDYADATKTSRFRGRSQDKIDIHGPAAMASIQQNGSFTEIKTMDDVRDLLNELGSPSRR